MNLNFNLKFDGEDMAKYARFMYPFLKDKFDDDEVTYGFNQLFSLKSEAYNKKFGYGGRPAVADWVDLFMKRRRKEIELINDKKRAIALNNARNGIEPTKRIEVDNSIEATKIQELIKSIGNNEG